MKRVETKNFKRACDKIIPDYSFFNDFTKKCIETFRLKNYRLMLIAFVLGNLMIENTVYANVTVTAATGGTISADKASNGTAPGYTTLGNITITEGQNKDFGTTGSLILTAPSGWSFKNSGVSTTVNNYSNVSVGSITYSGDPINTITIALTVSSKNNRDILTILGIQVQAIDGANVPGSGNITVSGTALPEGLSSGATIGSLSQTVGALNQIVLTLPGQTFNDTNIKNESGNNNATISTQTAGTAFPIELRATDQFYNVITTENSSISFTSTGNLLIGTTGKFTSGKLLDHLIDYSFGGNFILTANYNNLSTESSITVNNPIPTITNITPTVTELADFPLTVYGTNFNASSKIKLNNVELTTSMASSSNKLTANIAYTDIAAGGTFKVTVFNPTPGGGTSSENIFTVSSWLGTTSDWNSASNWYGNVIPTSTTNIAIPSGVVQPIINSTSECNNIIINLGASLTINAMGSLTVSGNLTNNAGATGLSLLSEVTSDNVENGTGSLMVKGSASGSATLTRAMKSGMIHLISSPLGGQSIQDFLSNNATIQSGTEYTDGNGVYHDNRDFRNMRDYNPTTNDWNEFFKTSISGNFGQLLKGKGYSISIRNGQAHNVKFSGTLPSGEVTVNGLTEQKWNCIGNPYTSAITINSSGAANTRFLENNIGNLDPKFASIYVWDPAKSSTQYQVISNATTPTYNLQQGQAFMVKMGTEKTSVNFHRNMQVHQVSLELKSTEDIWPTIQLQATADSINSSTTIAFHEGMTPGLDVSYDAGLLKAASPIYLYTRLVDDYGIPFAIQALPSDQYDQLIIPVGVDYAQGGQVTFSAKGMYLPSACSPILEDRQLGILTNLNDHTYTADLTANTAGTGRFYLHTSYSSTATDSHNSAPALMAWANGNHEINIKGQINNGAVASLFDLQGRLIVTRVLREGTRDCISLPAVKRGIYLLQVRDNQQLQTMKVRMEE